MVFTNIDEALNALMQRRRGLHPQLYKFSQLMNDLGNPQKKLKVIHVGGTNGKGSTTAFLANILTKANYKVGTFTSPHLISHHDRFKINQQIISDEKLLNYINRSYPYWDTYDITMFEIDVLIATWFFLDEQVDIAIYEVGMGGTYDATNIVEAMASVITTISYDHMNFLGNTLTAIAKEKAGIIKEKGSVFLGRIDSDLIPLFQQQAKRSLHFMLPPKIVKETIDYTEFILDNHTFKIQQLGSYQVDNAALAYTVIKTLVQQGEICVSLDHIKQGLWDMAWHGRFEVLEKEPYLILDGAHNVGGMRALINSLAILPRPIHAVFSALSDKETHEMLDLLQKNVDKVIVSEFEFYRAKKAIDLAEDFDVKIISDYQAAIALAKQGAKTVLITGSLYFISEVRAFLLENKHVS